MLEIGIKGYEERIVEYAQTAESLESGLMPVFGTPMMILMLEFTAQRSVQPFLKEGQSTVGTHVNVSHVAATPVGMKVKFESELIEADRRRLLFRVRAEDACGLIGEGTHERFIIDDAKFAAKAEEKKKLI